MYWCYKTVQCNNISKSLPIENLGQNHDFRTRETLRKSIFETLRKLAKLSGLAKLKIAKPCKLEILWNNAKPSYLRKFVKACESLRNLICENLRNLIVFAKAYLQSLWISYMHFARANACENTICINPIVKHYLRKPNCEMHHSYLLLAPPPPPLPLSGRPASAPPPQPDHPQLLQTLHHCYHQTNCKHRDYLSFACPKCFTVYQPMTKYKVSYTVVSSA